MSANSHVLQTPTHSVTARVSGDRQSVAETLTDVDTLLASLPGLDVSPGDGEHRDATLTVQSLTRDALSAGPASTIYDGSLRVAELEQQQGRIVLNVSGRQRDGGRVGGVRLTVAVADGPTQDGITDVLVAIDVDPGVSQDAPVIADLAGVGRRVVDQFAKNLELTLSRPLTSIPTTPTEPLPQSIDAPTGRRWRSPDDAAATTWLMIAAAIAVAALLLDRVRRRNR